jgi:hypothetical protein
MDGFNSTQSTLPADPGRPWGITDGDCGSGHATTSEEDAEGRKKWTEGENGQGSIEGGTEDGMNLEEDAPGMQGDSDLSCMEEGRKKRKNPMPIPPNQLTKKLWPRPDPASKPKPVPIPSERVKPKRKPKPKPKPQLDAPSQLGSQAWFSSFERTVDGQLREVMMLIDDMASHISLYEV